MVSAFTGVPSVFNGSLFSLLLSLSLVNSNPSPGFFFSFSLTASSCLRSKGKYQMNIEKSTEREHHLLKNIYFFVMWKN